MGFFCFSFSLQSWYMVLNGTHLFPSNIGKSPGAWCCNLCGSGQERPFYQIKKTKHTQMYSVKSNKLCSNSCSSQSPHGLASFLCPLIFQFCNVSLQYASFHHFYCAEKTSELVSLYTAPLFRILLPLRLFPSNSSFAVSLTAGDR